MLAVPRHVVVPCPRSVAGTLNISSSGRPCLQTGDGDGLRDAAGQLRPQRLRDGDAAEDDHHACETVDRAVRPRASPTRSSSRATGRCTGDSAYTVQRPVTRTVWKECTYTVCRPVRETHMENRSYTVCRPVRETTLQDVRLQRLHAGPRGHRTRIAATRSAGRCRRPIVKTVNYTVCRPVQETGYKNCTYTVCVPVPKTCYRTVPYTVQVPVQQTVMQCQPYTEMVPVQQCAYKQVPYTVCRPVQRDGDAGVPLHGLHARCSRTRDAELHLHRLPPGAARRSGRSAATRSAGPCRRPACKTVTETCYQTVTETACREVCETVCVPRTVVQQVTRDCGEWVTQQFCVPGKMICVQRLLVSVPAAPIAASRSGARDRWSRTSAARSTSRRSSASRCRTPSASRCRYCVTKQVPVTTCQMVAEECVKMVPHDHLPDGPGDLRQAGAGDDLRDGRGASASRWSR